MPNVHANGIDIEYERIGNESDPPLLLIMGLGAQMIAWDDEFCRALADRGHHVIRYDNRDTGLSTKIESDRIDFTQAMATAAGGASIDAPYTLTDMAADAAGLLDALDIPAAHIVGASMGGMIAQTLAIEHPEKVLTLTSIMSNTGDRDVGQPTPEAMQRLMVRPPEEREAVIANSLETSRVIGSPGLIDEERIRQRAAEAYDRCFYPVGIGRQLIGIMASGSRSEALKQLDVPTLVIHGSADPLVQVDGGRRTAEVIPGAELMIIDGMGHDLPQVFWPQIIDAICALTAKAPAEARSAQ